MMKKIFVYIFLLGLSFESLSASVFYENVIKELMPLKVNLEKGKCERVKLMLPVFKDLKKSKFTVYGDSNNFLISCNKKTNSIFKINFYKDSHLKHLLLDRNMKFNEIKEVMKKHFREHLLNATDGIEYKLLEVFVNKSLYQVIVYNQNTEQIEFVSMINMNEFPEYNYIGKLKNKDKIPPLITWLFD